MKLHFRVCNNESAFNFKANVMVKKKEVGREDWLKKIAYQMQLFHVFAWDLKISKQFQKELINRAAIPSEIDSTKAERFSVKLSYYWFMHGTLCERIRQGYVFSLGKIVLHHFFRICFNFHTCLVCCKHAQLAWRPWTLETVNLT